MKRLQQFFAIFVIIILLLAATPITPAHADIASTNLVGYWKLDDDATATTGSNGTLTGGSWSADHAPTGFANTGSLSLTGVANTGITMASVVTAATNNVTMAAWVKWTGGNGSPQAILYNGNSGPNGYGIYIFGPAGPGCNGCLGILNGGVAFASSTFTLTPGAWQYVVASRNAGTWRLYVDGTSVALTGDPAPNIPTGSASIGRTTAANNETFNGLIDDVRIYERVLTQDEITMPRVTGFVATSPSSSLLVPIPTFTAADTVDVTGYVITESAIPPAPGPAGWTGTAPGTYTVPGAGTYTLYAWAKDAAGNVSAPFTPVTVNVCSSAITVTSNADSGAGSLRQAIADVCAGGTITFDNNYTIALASQLTIGKNVTIDGAGRSVTVSGDTDGVGTGDVRVFYISSGGTLNLNQLTVTKGNAGSSDGGGIRNYGTLNVTNSTFSGNSTNRYGGGIYNEGTVNVTNSAFSGNSATYGGGIDNLGTVNVTNSAFSGNSATYGGGIDNLSTVNVTNSTFSGNSATYGGGINNMAGTVTSKNGIVANTTGGDNCSGTIVGSNNLANDSSCGASFTNSSSILLGSLGSYGGDTQTIPLLPGSSAIDAGSDAICAAAPVNNLDQRGIARPQGTACDIGAFESRGFTLGSLTGTPQSAAINTAFAPLGLTVTSAFSEPVAGGQVTFTPPGGGASAVITGSPATIAASGAVSVDATANGTVGGPYNVTASAAGATSVNFALTNGQITSTVTVGSSPNPSTYGNPVTFTATVAPAPTGGTVAFRDNGVDLAGCSAQPVDGSGQATCTTSALAGGTHTNMTAAYSGDANYAPSVSGSYSQTVDPAATTTTLNPDTPDPSVVGQLVTFNYTVAASGSGTPTGNVTVGNGTVSCTGTVAAGSCSVAVTAAGTTNFTAVYSGDGNFAGSNSGAASHTTDKAETTTTITSDAPDPSAIGQPVTIAFTVAPVAPGAGTPTGNVTVSDGTDSCTDTVAAGSCTLAFTSVGPKTLIATYVGDTDFNASTSATQAHTVNSAGTAITITADLPDPSGMGAALSVSYGVTVTGGGAGVPTGNVTVSDGVDSCTATVADGACSITLTTVGTRQLRATYAGDTNFGSSISAPEAHVVNGPPSVILINSNADTGDGQVLENEYASVAINQLLVVFSKAMNADTPADLDDALNVENYSLVQDGSTVISIDPLITYNAGTYTAILDVNSGTALPNGSYTLTVEGDIEDTLGAPIGTNFVRVFHVDRGAPTITSVVTLQGGAAISDGATINVQFSSIDVAFNEDVADPAGSTDSDDVTNPANYLLVTPGPNGAFDTVTCALGLAGDDVRVSTGPVTNSNNGGAGPFVAAVQLNNGTTLPNGTYRLYVCGTTSIVDLAGNALNNGADDQRAFTVLITTAGAGSSARRAPKTGFAPGTVTGLPSQPADKAYTDLGDLWLEIPKLGLKMPIVGVPLLGEEWNVSWLGANAGWLEGSAYPSWKGNSILTGHVWNADNSAGPFRYLNTLWWGDKVIVHLSGQQYIYEVRAVKQVKPTDIDAMMKHEELPWLTLITCKGYDERTDSYRYRIIVRAVLIDVK